MSQIYPHTAKSIVIGCIDDRLVESDTKFIKSIGDAFHVRLAMGGGALLDEQDQPVILKQILAAYQLAGVTKVYLQSHADCGGYRLSGVTFESDIAEINRLYGDLDQAETIVKHALETAGAPTAEIVIHTRVVDPAGNVLPRA